MQRIVSLTVLFFVFELIAIITSWQMPALPFWKWIELALAGSFLGRSIAYMTIGEPFRYWFTRVENHSSGVEKSVEPKDCEGWFSGLYILVACPICAGAWSSLGILFLLGYIPDMGNTMLTVLSAAGLGWLITRFTEMIEWGGRLLWEITGHWNNLNKERLNGRDHEAHCHADQER